MSHLWSAIWKVVKDAATLSTRSYYTSDKAAATLPGKLSRLLEKVTSGEATLRKWSRPAHQPAGTLGHLFNELYGIDEDTPGTAVMSSFADPEDASPRLATAELAKLVRNILKSALAHDLAAEVMLYFADAIRRGLDDAGAINELLGAFPEIDGSASA